MKRILVPTDFTLHSIDLAALAAKAIDSKVDIYLFHAFEMPGSLTETIRYGYGTLMSENLRIKCKKIKTQNSNISNISFRPMYGTTDAAFRNYAEANQVDLIVLPQGYKYNSVNSRSVNPVRMFRRSGIGILSDLSPASKQQAPEPQQATAMA
jgi:hypothetical protein